MTSAISLISMAMLLPNSASSFAKGDNLLMIYMLVVSAVFTVGIFVALICFSIKYRRRPGNLIAQNVPVHIGLEISWAAIPFLIFFVAFIWGAKSFLNRVTPPSNGDKVFVLAKQWMWKFEHSNGVSEINQLHVPVGRDIDLLMISEDVIHSFFVPAFRVKYEVLPGRYTGTWFRADKLGTYQLVCAQYCGADHSEMIGEVIVMTKTDYEEWLSREAQRTLNPTTLVSNVEAGRKIFATSGCISCHGEALGQARIGPLLQGRFSIGEESRVREDILRPSARIAAGYSDVMPSYAGKFSESELHDLVAYLTSEKTGQNHD